MANQQFVSHLIRVNFFAMLNFSVDFAFTPLLAKKVTLCALLLLLLPFFSLLFFYSLFHSLVLCVFLHYSTRSIVMCMCKNGLFPFVVRIFSLYHFQTIDFRSILFAGCSTIILQLRMVNFTIYFRSCCCWYFCHCCCYYYFCCWWWWCRRSRSRNCRCCRFASCEAIRIEAKVLNVLCALNCCAWTVVPLGRTFLRCYGLCSVFPSIFVFFIFFCFAVFCVEYLFYVVVYVFHFFFLTMSSSSSSTFECFTSLAFPFPSSIFVCVRGECKRSTTSAAAVAIH